MNPRVAVAQMISSDKVDENLRQAAQLAAHARSRGAGLLVLPENFAFMGQTEEDKLSIAEHEGSGPIQREIAALAKEYHLWLLAGTIPVKAGEDKVYAASLVYNSQGERVARYDKIHLFDVQVSEEEKHQESHTIAAGSQIVSLDTPVGPLGLSVCYDLRFPELYRQLTLAGAKLFAVPSAFTEVTGRAHWEILLKARAIENQCYVLAANQGGVHVNGRHTYGHSMIIDPWGKTLAALDKGEGLIAAEIDLPGLEEIRMQFPCNAHHVL